MKHEADSERVVADELVLLLLGLRNCCLLSFRCFQVLLGFTADFLLPETFLSDLFVALFSEVNRSNSRMFVNIICFRFIFCYFVICTFSSGS